MNGRSKGDHQPASPPRVLIDAGNLDLTEGTGLKTYTRTLEKALKANGWATDRLFGRNIPKGDDKTIAEVAFFAPPPPAGTRLQRRIRALAFRRRALFGGRREAQLVGTTQVVHNTTDDMPERIFNVSSLFNISILRHQWTGKFTRVRLPRSVDVFHLTYPWPLIVEGAKQVVTIHDLIPLRLPYTTLDNPAEIVQRHRRAVEAASLILTVSEASKADIVNLLGVAPEKVEVTYQTSDLARLSRVEINDQPRMLARHGLQCGDYLLFAGAIEPKKNLRRLIEAFLLSDIDIPLVITGPRAWLAEQELAALGNQPHPRVKVLGYVTLQELRFLYSGARAFVFPSLYEGFGLPVLEALNFGLPVLTSNISSLPEVAGRAAIYADPFNVRELREGLEALSADAELRGRLSHAARGQVALFSATRYRQRIAEAYGRLGIVPSSAA
jgi:glycosyltransferase involved in cell wall biosynthesis